MFFLDIRKNYIGDEGVTELAQALKHSLTIVHIDLSSNEIGPKGGSKLLKGLANNHSITSVDLSSHQGSHRNRILAKGIKEIDVLLKRNKILTILNLAGNCIKAEGLAYIADGIAENNTLMSLNLGQNEIQGNALTTDRKSVV